MSSCSSAAVRHRIGLIGERLRSESGQALVEAPVVIVLTIMLVLILMQPAIWLYTKAMVNGAAGAACRVAATDDMSFGGGKAYHDLTIKRWVIDRKLTALPKAELFQTGTPEVLITGDAKSWVVATVTVKQKPLPVIGTLFAAATTGLDSDGMVTVCGKAQVPGALRGIAGSQSGSSGTYGQDMTAK